MTGNPHAIARNAREEAEINLLAGCWKKVCNVCGCPCCPVFTIEVERVVEPITIKNVQHFCSIVCFKKK